MGGTKRVRSINWTEQEKKVLRMLVRERAHIIENKDTSTKTNSAKKLAWEEVMSGFNAVNEKKRDLAQLHNQWKNMKLKEKKTDTFRRAKNLTGGGTSPPSCEFTVDLNSYDSDTVFVLQDEEPSEQPELIEQPPKKKQKRNKFKSDCSCDETHEHQLFLLAQESRLETMRHEREAHECKMNYERDLYERRVQIMSLEHEYWQAKLIVRVTARVFSQNAPFAREKHPDQQIEYIKSMLVNKAQDWTTIRNDVLSKEGNGNQKNIDAILLKFMVSSKHYDAALSFAEHLKTTHKELSLGTMNGLLNLYYEIGKTEKLSKDHAKFILDAHKSLLEKYKVLDYSSSERLLHALCVINEWEKALKILADIHLTTTPTHSAYSTLVATLFGLNKKKKAVELIEESVKHKRPLLDNAYEAWMNYILRKYKDKKVIAKHLEEIFSHVATNCTVIPMSTAHKLKDLYSSMDWNAQFTKIRKLDGQCACCKDTLDCLSLSDEEFNSLQRNVKEKLIVGSDLFLKTSPEELKRFLDFVDKTAPYDIVLDGLNIAYTVSVGSHTDKTKLLSHVVDHFVRQKKKILLLGRQHMMRWNKRAMQDIMNKTSFFLTDNLSQDDPYFITAAIISGPQTDIVSKDLLRGHKFLLQDDSLRLMFKRWQWQHQWMVFPKSYKGVSIQPPLKFTPCAQKKNDTWHLPFERETLNTSQFNDGTPDLYSWICLRHK